MLDCSINLRAPLDTYLGVFWLIYSTLLYKLGLEISLHVSVVLCTYLVLIKYLLCTYFDLLVLIGTYLLLICYLLCTYV